MKLRYCRAASQLLDLVGLRFRALEPPARTIIGCAALLAYRFDLDLLTLCARVPTGRTIEALRRAQNLDLVVSESAPAQYRFRHDLTRTAIRRQLGLGLRRELHAMIAGALETRPDASARAEQLAYHWTAAGHTERAAAYCALAAQRARLLGLGG